MTLGTLRGLALALAGLLAAACAPTAAPMSAAGGRMAAPIEGAVYVLDTVVIEPGEREEVLAYYRDYGATLFAENGISNIGYWTPTDPADERLFILTYAPSLDAYDQALRRLPAAMAAADIPLSAMIAAGFSAESEAVFLQLADYSPSHDLEPPLAPRVFELRTYTAAPGKLADLHARFRDHTLDLFAKHGMENLLYFEVMDGQDLADDTLIYLLAFPSAEVRDAGFAAFLADPEWREVAAASEANGPIVAQGGVVGVMMQPTDFSPLR